MGKEPFNFRIDKELLEAMKSFAESERKNYTDVIEDSLREYLRDKGYWPPQNK